MIKFCYNDTLEQEIIIDKSINITEVYNLKNYTSLSEYLDFSQLFNKSGNLLEINKRLDLYKNYNLGFSKYNIQITIKHSKNYRKKLIGLSYLTNTGVKYIDLVKTGGSKSRDIPVEYVKNKDNLVIKYLLSNFLNLIIDYLSDTKNDKYSKLFIKVDKNFYINRISSDTMIMLYTSYKYGLLNKWVDLNLAKNI